MVQLLPQQPLLDVGIQNKYLDLLGAEHIHVIVAAQHFRTNNGANHRFNLTMIDAAQLQPCTLYDSPPLFGSAKASLCRGKNA